MITIKDYLEAINFQITGGSDYGWSCFGPNARYLDCNDSEGSDGTYSINAVFDSSDQTVYAIELWDYTTGREYRWMNSIYRSAYNDECREKEIDPNESLDGKKYIELEIAEDILDKISAVVAGEDYDSRVQIPVDFSDEDLLQYMKLAHQMDITFNELVERAIKNAVDSFNENPTEFKRKAERFLDENQTSV